MNNGELLSIREATKGYIYVLVRYFYVASGTLLGPGALQWQPVRLPYTCINYLSALVSPLVGRFVGRSVRLSVGPLVGRSVIRSCR